VTDFTLIRPGALHRANNGYLVIDARRLLQQPHAWEELKRHCAPAASHRVARAGADLVSTVSLEPEPIPLETRSCSSVSDICTTCSRSSTPSSRSCSRSPPISRTPSSATARASRSLRASRDRGPARGAAAPRPRGGRGPGGAGRAPHRHLLQAHRAPRQHPRPAPGGDHRASQESSDRIRGGDVVPRSRRRSGAPAGCASAPRRRSNGHGADRHERGTDRPGERAVRPAARRLRLRASEPHHARVRLGSGQLVDIEREVELGARSTPRAFSSSRAFSAPISRASTRCRCTRASSSSSPMAASRETARRAPSCWPAVGDRRGAAQPVVAVTGSVNQLGQVQPIGGVNEKIEASTTYAAERG